MCIVNICATHTTPVGQPEVLGAIRFCGLSGGPMPPSRTSAAPARRSSVYTRIYQRIPYPNAVRPYPNRPTWRAARRCWRSRNLGATFQRQLVPAACALTMLASSAADASVGRNSAGLQFQSPLILGQFLFECVDISWEIQELASFCYFFKIRAFDEMKLEQSFYKPLELKKV